MSEKNEPQRPLPYERSGSATTLISRGQFRWLLILLTIHLLIVVQSTYAPGLRLAVKEWRAERQAKAAREAAAKQGLALEQQAMTFAEPAARVVWEEDPDAAAALMAGGGYRWIKDDADRSSSLSRAGPLPRGAMALLPPILAQAVSFDNWSGPPFDRDEVALVFLHGRKSPGGKDRLVWVYVAGRMTTSSGLFTRDAADPDKPWTRQLGKEVTIVAVPCVPGGGEKRVESLSYRATALHVDQHGRDDAATWTHTPGGGQPGKVKLEQRVRLRLMAGQPDPADPTRFTIAYDVNGQTGTLQGRLKDDDTIELRPSTGKVVGDRWYPPTTQALTRPAGG